MRRFALLALLLVSATLLHSGEANPTSPDGKNVFICGHSFHVYVAKPLEELARAAGITGHINAGVQFLGGSSVTQHWNLPDDKDKTKKALATGKIDVLTLSPNWVMPDDAIGKFLDLALEKNPKTRVIIQMSWPAFDSASMTGVILSNDQRDTKPVADVANAMQSMRPTFEKMVHDLNDKLKAKPEANKVCVAPVALAVLALREKVAKGEAPGLTKQSELFTDALGHGKEHIKTLAAYCWFATIYQKSPVGLKVFEKKGNENWNKLNRILQEIAWDSVTQYPLSGVTAK